MTTSFVVVIKFIFFLTFIIIMLLIHFTLVMQDPVDRQLQDDSHSVLHQFCC